MIAPASVAQTSVCASLNWGTLYAFARTEIESHFSNFVFRVSFFESCLTAEKT